MIFFKKIIFFKIYNNGKFNPWRKNIIEDIRNLFRLKQEQNYTAIKDIRSLSRPEKESKAIKDRILKEIKDLFEHEKKKEKIIINQ